MARYLVDGLEVFPESRPTLEKLLETDNSERIRVYLARALLSPDGAK